MVGKILVEGTQCLFVPGRTSVDRNSGQETFLLFGRQKKTWTTRTIEFWRQVQTIKSNDEPPFC